MSALWTLAGDPVSSYRFPERGPDATVSKTCVSHFLGVIDITQIDQDRGFQRCFHPFKIERTKFVPLGQDGHGGCRIFRR